METFSDQYLLKLYLRGDRGAFDALYRRYAARVYGTAYRLTGQWEDAEDTLQEVFITLARSARTIRDGQALSAWIYRATLSRSYDLLRRRRPTAPLDPGQPAAARVIAAESLRRQAQRDESLRREALLEQVTALVPRLPQRQAEVFVLRAFQGLPHREIAQILGGNESSIKSLYSLAIKKLRGWCEGMEADMDFPFGATQGGEAER